MHLCEKGNKRQNCGKRFFFNCPWSPKITVAAALQTVRGVICAEVGTRQSEAQKQGRYRELWALGMETQKGPVSWLSLLQLYRLLPHEPPPLIYDIRAWLPP